MQKVVRLLAATRLVVVALLVFEHSALAQIAPFHEAIEFSAVNDSRSTLTIKAANGSPAYVVTLRPYVESAKGASHIELFLQRPHAKSDASNLLEPEYRWHGIQEYDFVAVDFADGMEKSKSGTAGHIKINRRKLDVTFSVTKAKTHATDGPFPENYVFDELAVEVSVENTK